MNVERSGNCILWGTLSAFASGAEECQFSRPLAWIWTQDLPNTLQ